MWPKPMASKLPVTPHPGTPMNLDRSRNIFPTNLSSKLPLNCSPQSYLPREFLKSRFLILRCIRNFTLQSLPNLDGMIFTQNMKMLGNQQGGN